MRKFLDLPIYLILFVLASPAFAAENKCERALDVLYDHKPSTTYGDEIYPFDMMEGDVLKIPLIARDGSHRRLDPDEYRFTAFISEKFSVEKVTGFKIGRRLIQLDPKDYGILSWKNTTKELVDLKKHFPDLSVPIANYSLNFDEYGTPLAITQAARPKSFSISRQMLRGPGGFIAVEIWIYKGSGEDEEF